MNKPLIFSILCCHFVLTSTIECQTPLTDPSWIKVWEDEFQGNSVNSHKWCLKDERLCYDPDLPETKDQNEAHSYSAFRTTNNIQFNTNGTGSVIQWIHNQPITVPNVVHCDPGKPNFSQITYDYSASPKFTSNTKFKYGYFEIRCKLPNLSPAQNNSGIGANFWLYWHDEHPTPYFEYGEIDVFEFSSNPNPHTHTFNTYFSPVSGPTISEKGFASEFDSFPYLPVDFTTFHTFAVSWTPDRIDFYRDDQFLYSSTNHPKEMIPLRMVVDVNVFTSGETPDANTLFPYPYEIDYVRVYKLRNYECNKAINTSNLSTIQPSIYKEITINNNAPSILQNGQNLICRASEGVTVEEGFEVKEGGIFVADITECHQQTMESCALLRKNCPEFGDCFRCRRCPRDVLDIDPIKVDDPKDTGGKN